MLIFNSILIILVAKLLSYIFFGFFLLTTSHYLLPIQLQHSLLVKQSIIDSFYYLYSQHLQYIILAFASSVCWKSTSADANRWQNNMFVSKLDSRMIKRWKERQKKGALERKGGHGKCKAIQQSCFRGRLWPRASIKICEY